MRWMTLIGVLLMFPASALAQPNGDAGAPLTPWGDPNLQGMWPSGGVVMVPFERSEELGTRAVFTEEERAAQVQAFAALVEMLTTRGTGPGPVWVPMPNRRPYRPPWWLIQRMVVCPP